MSIALFSTVVRQFNSQGIHREAVKLSRVLLSVFDGSKSKYIEEVANHILCRVAFMVTTILNFISVFRGNTSSKHRGGGGGTEFQANP